MTNMRNMLESEILPRVSRPGRYAGGEFGVSIKPDSDVDVRIALAYPDVYEIGMSHIGLKILYSIVNGRPGFAAERVYAPWPDMEKILSERNIPLCSLETFRPLNEFHLVGFSLQYELTYTNILTMLSLGNIPLLSREREEGDFPLVIAGGPGAFSPGPLEDFIDLFVAGDGEEAIVEVMEAVREWNRPAAGGRRRDLLLSLARGIKGVYIPSLYGRSYSPEGRLLSCTPLEKGVPAPVVRRMVPRLATSERLVDLPVPNIEVVHDRVAMEARRGCGQGCRFCQAGFIYRPVRDESPDALCSAAIRALNSSGYDEIALCALSIGDLPFLGSVVEAISRGEFPGPVSISLPSLRPEGLAGSIMRLMGSGRKTGMTLAPEAGTEEMRLRMNKKVSIENLMRFAAEMLENGRRLIKLYFMIGLPGEREEDVKGIADLVSGVASIRARGGGRLDVNVTIASFIPKAHTPFQWEPMDSAGSLLKKQAIIKKGVRAKNVRLRFNDPESSLIEAVFSRGDASLGRVIYLAWQKGCRFDGWRETFLPILWRQAFEEAGIDPESFAYRRFSMEDYLPWEIIDSGVSRRFLAAERDKASRGILTPDCTSKGCQGCGVCNFFGIKK